MGDAANKQRFGIAKADAQDALDQMDAEFQTAWNQQPSPAPGPTPTPVPPPTPTGAMMGKPQGIENQGSRHTFAIDHLGRLLEFEGEHEENCYVIDADYEPFADVTIKRVYPGPPDNPFYTWYTVSGWGVGHVAMRNVRWWGKAFGAEADHWEGPWATNVPADDHGRDW